MVLKKSLPPPHDGLFDVSAWLDYSPQLLNQTLIEVLLCRYSVDMIKVHNQLTLREVTLHNLGGPGAASIS